MGSKKNGNGWLARDLTCPTYELELTRLKILGCPVGGDGACALGAARRRGEPLGTPEYTQDEKGMI